MVGLKGYDWNSLVRGDYNYHGCYSWVGYIKAGVIVSGNIRLQFGL